MHASNAEPAAGDNLIVTRAAAGDGRAWAALIGAHGPRVYALCRRMCPGEADDAYQATWERVLRALPRFDPHGPASVGTWIGTIAYRHLVDRHRRRSVRGEVVLLPELVASGPSPEEHVGRRQRSQRLEVAISSLPAAQRRVVVGHHVQGMGLQEIAEAEGVAVGTVKSRLHRARAGLVAKLRGMGR